MWWCLGGLTLIVLAVVGGGVVLALSACQYDPTDATTDAKDEENDQW